MCLLAISTVHIPARAVGTNHAIHSPRFKRHIVLTCIPKIKCPASLDSSRSASRFASPSHFASPGDTLRTTDNFISRKCSKRCGRTTEEAIPVMKAGDMSRRPSVIFWVKQRGNHPVARWSVRRAPQIQRPPDIGVSGQGDAAGSAGTRCLIDGMRRHVRIVRQATGDLHIPIEMPPHIVRNDQKW